MALDIATAISYIVIAAIAVVLLYIIFRIGKSIVRIIFGLILNTVFGFAALFLLNYAVGLNIPFTTPVIIVTALFGLPAVGTMVILKLTGAAALAILLL